MVFVYRIDEILNDRRFRKNVNPITIRTNNERSERVTSFYSIRLIFRRLCKMEFSTIRTIATYHVIRTRVCKNCLFSRIGRTNVAWFARLTERIRLRGGKKKKRRKTNKRTRLGCRSPAVDAHTDSQFETSCGPRHVLLPHRATITVITIITTRTVSSSALETIS